MRDDDVRPVNALLMSKVLEQPELEAFVLTVRTVDGTETTYAFGDPTAFLPLAKEALRQIGSLISREMERGEMN